MLDQLRFSKLDNSQEYRSSYVGSRVRLAIAAQIRALREQYSSSQAEFAKLVDMKQSVISRLENPDYGQMSIQTLLRLASKLDIALVVKFASYEKFFSELDIDFFEPRNLQVDNFAASRTALSGSRTVFSFSHLRKREAQSRWSQILDSNGDLGRIRNRNSNYVSRQIRVQNRGDMIDTMSVGRGAFFIPRQQSQIQHLPALWQADEFGIQNRSVLKIL